MPKAEISENYATESDRLCECFASEPLYWQEIYGRRDVYSVIHQERRAVVLSLVDKLRMPARSDVLDVGCGAGSTSIALAQRGHAVQATDIAAPMLALTRRLADEAGVGPLIETKQCDIYNLPFQDNSFALVMAMGVLPWLSSWHEAMREMVRVLQPGGYLIVNTDNRYRITHLLHPFAWTRLAGITLPDRLRAWKRHKIPPVKYCSVSDFDARLPGLGLERMWGATLGFGPFWLVKRVLPESFGVKLHQALQGLANRGVPLIRSAGAQYITLSRKVG